MERGAGLGKLPAPPTWPDVPPAALVACYWFRLWTQHLSSWDLATQYPITTPTEDHLPL